MVVWLAPNSLPPPPLVGQQVLSAPREPRLPIPAPSRLSSVQVEDGFESGCFFVKSGLLLASHPT